LEGLPFGGKFGKGVVGCQMGRIWDVEQHCDGGLHLGVGEQGQYSFGFGWPFDEDDIGLKGLEGLQEATG
jgi:hypothetical protein